MAKPSLLEGIPRRVFSVNGWKHVDNYMIHASLLVPELFAESERFDNISAVEPI